MKRLLVISSWLVLLGTGARSQVTQRVSVHPAGGQVPDRSDFPVITPDGRFVGFQSLAPVDPLDDNALSDVYVRDRQGGTSERMSVDSAGMQADGESWQAAISDDGRFVAFSSAATNLVPGDTNATEDIFLHDRQSGATERVSVGPGGVEADFQSVAPCISADGRYVSFMSFASNLVAGDTNGHLDVFVRDRLLGVTERVSVDSTGSEGHVGSSGPAMSADGRYVAFNSPWRFDAGDTDNASDVFVRDRQAGTTECVSVASSGMQVEIWCTGVAISADGRYVAFEAYDSALVPGDANHQTDVLLRDRSAGTTEIVSRSSSGLLGNSDSEDASISGDGRYVVFGSTSSNFDTGGAGGNYHAFLRDRQEGTTRIVDVNWAGVAGNNGGGTPFITPDGRYVAFGSSATNLVPGDTNQSADIFMRDRTGGTSFTSLCDPGVDGVAACPCSNPPSGLGRGCDNSSATGGATLTATGGAYRSSDTLVFTTSDEKPAALSILLQGRALVASGLVYGQGVRCLGTALKRLYTKNAVGGSITAPSFASGDASVAARSSALGDVIQPGQSRWYLVFYRDPTVLGGCPKTSTFNATQTGVVSWAP